MSSGVVESQREAETIRDATELLALARDVVRIEARGVASLAERLDGRFLEAVDLILGATGRVVVTGVGKSGLVARKIASTLASTGTPALFLHPVEGAHGDVGVLRRGDVPRLARWALYVSPPYGSVGLSLGAVATVVSLF